MLDTIIIHTWQPVKTQTVKTMKTIVQKWRTTGVNGEITQKATIA